VARGLRLEIDFQDGAFASTGTVTEVASTTLGRRSLTAKAPAGTEFVSARVFIPSSLLGETFDLDAFAVLLNAPNSDYFDGDSIGGSWAGGAYNGPSTMRRLETEDEWAAYARDAIKRQGGKNRGTIDAMMSAAEDTLMGTRTARLLERVGGNAYALTLVTRPSETPDAAATLAATMRQKPAGMSLTHTLTEGAIIDEGTLPIDSVAVDIDAATLADIT